MAIADALRCPGALCAPIRRLQALMLPVQINNGVYKSGFSTKQAAYERAQAELYAALDQVEARLSQHRFLVGDR